MAEQDYLIALQIQMQLIEADDDQRDLSEEAKYKHKKQTNGPDDDSRVDLVNPEWELVDPCPDIRALFQEYDKKYFWSTLGSCIIEWSKRMTICAGIFYLREGGIIRLSEPLLKYRPRNDLVQTLLHEMIHAYLYLTRNFKDRGEHGDEFKSHMDRINRLAGTHITVYHSFHDEVNHARQHVWRCNGPCRDMKPFNGYVKRSMNRAPGKYDNWWASHQMKCNGTFEKISEPEGYGAKKSGSKRKLEDGECSSQSQSQTQKKMGKKSSQPVVKIDAFLIKSQQPNYSQSASTQSSQQSKFSQFSSTQSSSQNSVAKKSMATSTKVLNDDVIVIDDDAVASSAKVRLVECPMCFNKFDANSIENHVNSHFWYLHRYYENSFLT